MANLDLFPNFGVPQGKRPFPFFTWESFIQTGIELHGGPGKAIYAHREEAGAPEAPELDESTLPPMPGMPGQFVRTPILKLPPKPDFKAVEKGEGKEEAEENEKPVVNGTVVPPKPKAMPPNLAAATPKMPVTPAPAVAPAPVPCTTPTGPTVAPRAPLRPSWELNPSAAKRPRIEVAASPGVVLPNVRPRPVVPAAPVLGAAPRPVVPGPVAVGAIAPRPVRGATVPVRPKI